MTDALTTRPHAAVTIDAPPVADARPEAPAERAGAEPRPPSRWRRRLDDWAGRLTPMGVVTAFVVAACVLFVFYQLGPGDLFANNTPAGGDMGAHVWGPAYLRDHLLTKGRLSGWTPDWYAGFPAYQFYMVLPSLAIALLSFVIPYGIAFKLVAVSGVLSLPVAAWACGRLSGLPFPAPALMAVGGTVFLFDRSFSIYGGNIPSTLAGEFAFSISLSLALVYIGFMARGLRTGRSRGWTAVFLALAALCHIIPFIFALVCTGILLLLFPGLSPRRYGLLAGIAGAVAAVGAAGGLLGMKAGWAVAALAVVAVVVVGPGWQRFTFWAPSMVVGGLLSAWWTAPFYLRSAYLNDMGWEKIDSPAKISSYLFSRDSLDSGLVNSPNLKFVFILAGAGLLLSLIWWHRGALLWALGAGAFAMMFIYLPEGRLWNARLLPFYYLSLYFLAAIGVAEIGRLIATLFARDVNRPIRTVTCLTALVGLAAGLVVVALPLRTLPLGSNQPDGSYSWFGLETKETSFVSSWAKWNFTGYEGKDAYPEYHGVVEEMRRVGQQHGCGRAMWEHEEQHDRYGTPMALMLLPFWTDGCIGSMEGLYFEASATTPYHFINQDELSVGPSNAQRDLPYDAGRPTRAEFDEGIQHLKLMGVRYYMAISDGPEGMVAFAGEHPDLTKVGESGPWSVFQIRSGNELVEPLQFQPAVVNPNIELPTDYTTTTDASGKTVEKKKTGSPWQFTAVDWYTDAAARQVELAADGPAEWQRVDRGQPPDRQALPANTVSNINAGDDSISFDVAQPGVPVLVKASYFPNWKVSGGQGPYRVTPNLMVVVPDATHVELHYGYTGVDYLSWFLTLLGLVGLFFLFRHPSVVVPESWSAQRARRREEAERAAAIEVMAPGQLEEVDPEMAAAGVAPDPRASSMYEAGAALVGLDEIVPPGSRLDPTFAPETGRDDIVVTTMQHQAIDPDAPPPPGVDAPPVSLAVTEPDGSEDAAWRPTDDGTDPSRRPLDLE